MEYKQPSGAPYAELNLASLIAADVEPAKNNLCLVRSEPNRRLLFRLSVKSGVVRRSF
jgi:hypothetical protein